MPMGKTYSLHFFIILERMADQWGEPIPRECWEKIIQAILNGEVEMTIERSAMGDYLVLYTNYGTDWHDICEAIEREEED